ncbi:MAG: DUF1566 domain-containing protein [Gammaproteobacteria bacterium]|nr:DUF1566 domain-containing protein [Gammaproteobacteria bacterium]MBU1723643.1 DUF1566 domain-containing protein [Gammaproteobacteria bacterium]MBU2005639.1 DUF1566 domain-containing protein [Gammaproteobacteria bacterium]
MIQRGDALPDGYELDRYRIERLLGEGGFSITYLAQHLLTGKTVVIKEYLPSEFAVRESGKTVSPRGTKSEEAYRWGLARFMDEARTLETFANHPNIVSVRDIFEANGTAYLVMQYEEGQTFGQWLADHPHPTEQQLLDIFIPVLDGLREVHAKDFLHRDIKPGNIYIRSDGRPLLIDFGASRQSLGEHSRSLTSIYTPGYAPKEQYSKRGKQGSWTDIYATAATMWRAISGQEPEPALDRGEAINNGEPDPLHPALEIGRVYYSENFLKAIDWGLSFDPQKRPQTVKEWQNALIVNSQFRQNSTYKSAQNQTAQTPKSTKPSSLHQGKKTRIKWIGLILVVSLLIGSISYGLIEKEKRVATQITAKEQEEVNHKTDKLVSSRYIVHGDSGTVTDKKTGLMWKRCPEGKSGQHCDKGSAKIYGWDKITMELDNGISFGGYDDWRLPTFDEVLTLVWCESGTLEVDIWEVYCTIKPGDWQKPAIDLGAFPNAYFSNGYWVSDQVTAFIAGGVDGWNPSSPNINANVWLVRSQ